MPAYADEVDGQVFTPAAPVARVSVRHPNSGAIIPDVLMLIDSGADVTLLPKSAVTSIGITGTGRQYPLEGFDGRTNESEAVEAHVLFLGKTFRGQFLQVESDVGVIGRNVLNRLRLLLDGPARNWEELA